MARPAERPSGIRPRECPNSCCQLPKFVRRKRYSPPGWSPFLGAAQVPGPEMNQIAPPPAGQARPDLDSFLNPNPSNNQTSSHDSGLGSRGLRIRDTPGCVGQIVDGVRIPSLPSGFRHPPLNPHIPQTPLPRDCGPKNRSNLDPRGGPDRERWSRSVPY